MIVSGMESYIPHTVFNTKLKSPGLTLLVLVLSSSHPSAETHAIYTSTRNHANYMLQLTKKSFINRKCKNLSNSNSSRDSWHLAQNTFNNFTYASSPPLLQPDGSTAVSSFSKSEFFAQSFATNSTLDDTEHIPPTLPKMKILYYDLFYALSSLDYRLQSYSQDGVSPVVLKNCASELAPCLVKLFRLCLSTFTYPSCWKFAHI